MFVCEPSKIMEKKMSSILQLKLQTMPGKQWGLGRLGVNRSHPDAIDGWNCNVHSFLLTKCLCSHLIHILNSKMNHGVPQAVSADAVGQVQLECINYLIQEKSAFSGFSAPYFAYIPCISVLLRRIFFFFFFFYQKTFQRDFLRTQEINAEKAK